MVNVQDVWDAKALIHKYIHHTPTIYSTSISHIAGKEVYLTCENFQKTGSFKARGAFNHILNLSQAQKEKGVVCFSSGNHSQAVGYAASMFHIESWLVMPEYTAPLKVECSKGYGTHTVVYGKTGQETYRKALEIQKEYKLDYIDPGEDAAVIAGQGTIGLEILEDIPDADVIYVPVGGGGLIGGIAVAVKALSPRTKVIGVEPENMDAMYRSVKAGKIEVIERVPSIADGLGGTSPCHLPFDIVSHCVDDIITVSEAEIARATKMILQRTKMFAEPSGGTALAGLLSGKLPFGKKNVCVISGGNATPEVMADILVGRYE